MLGGSYLKSGAERRDRLREPEGVVLKLIKDPEGGTEIVLSCRPLEGDALAGPFSEGGAITGSESCSRRDRRHANSRWHGVSVVRERRPRPGS